MTADFGLEVIWNGLHNIDIIVPRSYKGGVQGLCGVYSDESHNVLVGIIVVNLEILIEIHTLHARDICLYTKRSLDLK